MGVGVGVGVATGVAVAVAVAVAVGVAVGDAVGVGVGATRWARFASHGDECGGAILIPVFGSNPIGRAIRA